MAKITQIIGAGALALWTLAGAAAWMLVGDGLEVTLQERGVQETTSQEALLLDRVETLESDLRGLAQSLESNFATLIEGLQANSERTSALRSADLQRINESVVELAARPALQGIEAKGMRPTPLQAETKPSMPKEKSQPEPKLVAALSGAPRSRGQVEKPELKKSFLSFKLPSTDFAFDEERTWAILPQLSRVGFDGSSTLHDFSAVSLSIKGSFTVNLAHTELASSGTIQVQADSLNSGLVDRDTAMREHLLTEEHGQIMFQIERFLATSVDPSAKRLEGLIRGKMSIRGVSRVMEIPVELFIDDSGRLNIDGQAPLDLTDFEIPVPNKLGLVKMKNRVQIWLSLRARCQPRQSHS